jgi:hypothetical protein
MNVTIPAKPNQESAGIINRALFQEKAPAFAKVYSSDQNGNKSVTIVTAPTLQQRREG